MTDAAADAADAFERDASVCPHCGSQARIETDASLRWVCAVCGGPRIKVADARALTKKSAKLLTRSNAAKKSAFVRRMLAIGLGLTGTLLAGLAATLATVSAAVGVVLALAALPMMVVAFVQVLAASRRRDESKRLAFEAWEDVAETLLRLEGRDVTAEEMATLLDVDVAEAERVMTVLAAEDRARVDIGGAAELRYRVPDLAMSATGVATNDALAQAEAESDAGATLTKRSGA